MTASRKKRIWCVADFAQHAYGDDAPAARLRARRFLLRLHEKHGGKLLIPSQGTNREYTFFPSTLARLEPDLFTPIESVEYRLDELEDDVGELRVHQKRIVAQVGQNTRDVARLSKRARVA
jgi:hypothetical protein